jgi:hypothetical protein
MLGYRFGTNLARAIVKRGKIVVGARKARRDMNDATMEPVWFSVHKIPYGLMWDDSIYCATTASTLLD